MEQYIIEKLGADYLANVKGQAELRHVKKELSSLKRKITELEARKQELEDSLRNH